MTDDQSDHIYLSPPHVGPLERAMLLEAFDSNWIGPVGPGLRAFEDDISGALGGIHAVALSSGTAALHMALRCLKIGMGDVVILPSFTFVATVNAVLYVGATPLFIDSSVDTWAIDPMLVAAELDARAGTDSPVRAVICVDVYGQCCDYAVLQDICGRHNVPIIEDAAEALGSTYRGRPAGTFGAAAVMSFNGNKIITSGGGGVLLTWDGQLADNCRYLATQAREPATPHYEHKVVGYNYRLCNLLAAIGQAQLASLDEKVSARRMIYQAYQRAFKGTPGVQMMPVASYGEPNCWLSCILIEPELFGASVADVYAYLTAKGIECRPTWKPMHMQPAFQGLPSRGGRVCSMLFSKGLCLPSGSQLSKSQQKRVMDTLLAVPSKCSARA